MTHEYSVIHIYTVDKEWNGLFAKEKKRNLNMEWIKSSQPYKAAQPVRRTH